MPLFHPRVLKKALKKSILPLPKIHQAILEDWHNSIESEQIFKQKETSLHSHFIQKILIDILGYQGFNPTETYHLYQECSIGKGSVDVALGYFTTDNIQVIAPFELKGAKTKDLDAIMSGRYKSPVQQAWEYAMDAMGARWVLVSNYLEIRLYAIGYGRQVYEVWDLARLTEPMEYARFILLLSQENLLGTHTTQLLKESEQVEKEITALLYQDYKTLRDTLIKQLKQDNPAINELEAIAYSQNILDRLLFIAFAEDTGLLPHNSLKQAYEHRDPYNPHPIWENFKGLFHSIDQGNTLLNIPPYNGGLFQKNERINALIVNDSVCEAFKNLGEYDFDSEISVTVLGHIFEQSISDLEELRETKIEPVSKRKREGVVYTPDNITRFIVEETLGRYLTEQLNALWESHTQHRYQRGEWKNKKEEIRFWRDYQAILKTMKVVDPACGSGAFLVAAFDYLYIEYTRINDKLETLTGNYDVFDLDKEILNRNLYGVDVNSESIEITKLSLWLKTAKRGKFLNRLDENLRIGDSLIEDSNISYRAFAWKKAFPDVFANGGFDVILGNPPYVRQELIAPFKPYLKNQYEIYNGTADLYTYFFERGLRLLKPHGKLGYICSSTFFKTRSGQQLRCYLQKNTTIEKVIDFGDLQVFENVTTYPAILILAHSPPQKNHALQFLKLEKIPEEGLLKDFIKQVSTMPQALLTENNWRLRNGELTKLWKKITENLPTLKELYGEPYRGVLTGLNKAFVIDKSTRDQLIAQDTKTKNLPTEVYSSPLYGIKTGLNEAFIINQSTRNQLIAQDAKSVEVIKPFLEGKDLKKWRAEPRDLYLIFTKRGINIEAYPAIKAYLTQYKDQLEPKPKDWQGPWQGRKKGYYQWYEIQDTVAYYEAFEKPKIIWSNLQAAPRFSLDTTGFFINAQAVILPCHDYFLVGLLNSNMIWFYLKNLAILRRQGFLEAKPVYIKQIPIPIATDSEKNEIATLAEQCQQIAETRYQKQIAVRRRIPDLCSPSLQPKLNTKLTNWWTLDFNDFRKEVKKCFKADIPLTERNDWEIWLTTEKAIITQLNQQLEQLEQQLNQKVYALFELTTEEIKWVEENA